MKALAVIAAVVLAASETGALAQETFQPLPGGGALLGPENPEDLPGAVDVCVRWGADPAHLADVVMTASSGDVALDARIPEMIRSIPYPKPEGDAGEWFGLSLSFGAAPPHKTLPDCTRLPGDGLNGPPAPS